MIARKISAGLLVFRHVRALLEVLLVHPGGPFWMNKDDGAWTIPKGQPESGEAPLDAARREFAEELGRAVAGDFIELPPVRQAGGKLVHAWAVRGEFDTASIQSNTFSMEWPPRSGQRQSFPEIDRAEWFPFEIARRKILASQVPLLDALQAHLAHRP